jgi:carboxymethylenebutenolidase
MVMIHRQTRRGKPLNAYLAAPAGGRDLPGVVVIHELFGLNDHIKSVADRFADHGYAALAVDLLGDRRQRLCVVRLFAGLVVRPRSNRALKEIRDGVRWLQRQPNVDSGKIGVIGFCMGGGFALAVACVDDQVKASSAFYGLTPRPVSMFAHACPIVASYGEEDQFFVKRLPKLRNALDEYAVPHDVEVYPNAGHAFFNDTLDTYRPEAAEDAWRRTLDFFQEHLGIDPARPSAG